jgi:hypothetical protein
VVTALVDEARSEVVRSRPDGVDIWFGLDDNGRLVAAAGVGRGNAVPRLEVRGVEHPGAGRARSELDETSQRCNRESR